MNRFIIPTLFLIWLFPPGLEAQEMIKEGESLNLERCIEIARVKNPALAGARDNVDVTESRIGEARSNYYPQVSGSAGYSRISPLSSGRSVVTSSGEVVTNSAGGAFNQYSAALTLSQNIYDFGRTSSQVKIAGLNRDTSITDLENVAQQTILGVKQAYYGVLQAKRSRDVNIDTVKQFELHLEQAKGFFEVGTKPKFDVTKAEVDLSNARLNLIKAENALRIAVVNLNNAMGVPSSPQYSVEDNLSFKKYEITFEEARLKAFENRPDLKSAVTKSKAAEAGIDSARSNFFPFLTGSASYSWGGESLNSIDHGWSAGAAVSVPIFNGLLTVYQVKEAKANFNVLKSNEEVLRQTVVLDLQTAYLNLKQAEESVPTAELGVKQAQENMDIANGRYKAGVGNPIEVADAEVLLANAKLNYIQALYNYKVSQADLEKAMGTR